MADIAPQHEKDEQSSTFDFSASLVGLMSVRQSLQSMTDEERQNVAQTCLEFASNKSSGVCNGIETPSNDQMLQRQSTLYASTEVESSQEQMPVEASNAENFMVNVPGHDLVSSVSTITDLPVNVLLKDNAIVVMNGDGVVCQHLCHQVTILSVSGPHGMLTYIGKDVLSSMRRAVVLRLESLERAKDMARQFEKIRESWSSRLITRMSICTLPVIDDASPSVRTKTTAKRTVVPHWSTYSGATCFEQKLTFFNSLSNIKESEEQKTTNDKNQTETSNNLKKNLTQEGKINEDQPSGKEETGLPKNKIYPATENTDSVMAKLEEHIGWFCKSEEQYRLSLDRLTSAIEQTKDKDITQSLQDLDEIRHIHSSIKDKFKEEQININLIEEIFLKYKCQLESYVQFIRHSRTLDDSCFQSNTDETRELLEKIQLVRLKPHHYSLAFESWLELVQSESEKHSLKNIIELMKGIIKKADSYLLIDNIKKCPYDLESHLPIETYGQVSVTGRGFKNEVPYTVLLLQNLLVFASISSKNTLECLDALRLEHLLLNDAPHPTLVEIDVYHGERRGRETITIKCPSEVNANKWRDAIWKQLFSRANKTRETNRSVRQKRHI